MLLFKYFEKKAKDALPDPNGLLSSREPSEVPSDESVDQPGKRYDQGITEYSYSYLLSRQHLKERNVVHTIYTH